VNTTAAFALSAVTAARVPSMTSVKDMVVLQGFPAG
jgi:hypothetical protein